MRDPEYPYIPEQHAKLVAELKRLREPDGGPFALSEDEDVMTMRAKLRRAQATPDQERAVLRRMREEYKHER